MPKTASRVEKAKRESLNLKDEQIQQLKRLFPEVVADGKVNWEKLKAILGETIDMSFEKFSFTWAGKGEAIRNVLMPSKATLRPDKKESIRFDQSQNIFIEGDNLEALKLLQNAYFERVKMIYIDPPYNTGNDFVYKDDFRNSIKNYLSQTGQIDNGGNRLQTNTEANGRFHSDWLNMLYPRLKLAWNLLASEGVIFISIDDNELHHLKLMMNEIFGEENLVAHITILSNPRGRQSERFVATVHEYVLVYAKDASSAILGGVPLTGEQTAEFKHQDEKDRKYRLLGLRQRGAASRREDRPDMYYPIYVNPKNRQVSLNKSKDFSVAVLPKKSTGQDGRWGWGKKKVSQNTAVLEARLISGRNEWDVFVRDYLASEDGEERTRKFKTIWDDKEFNYQNGTTELKEIFGFLPLDYPKPVALIKKMILMVGSSDGIILDFFAGSGTTAQAVLETNKEDGGGRKLILAQLPEPIATDSECYKKGYKTIADIAKERIRRVIKGYGDNPEPIEDGFKVFKLSRSNYPENNFEFDPEQSEKENEKTYKAYLEKAGQLDLFSKASEVDLVYENIIKEGLDLNSKITEMSLGKNKVFQAKDEKSEIMICLDSKVADATVKALSSDDYKGKIFICYDKAVDDSAKANLGLHLSLRTI